MRTSSTPIVGLASFVFLYLTACQEPVNPPPVGYVDSCYGGDFREFREGSVPQLTLYVTATEKDWINLRGSLAEFGRANNLDVFDTSKSEERVRMAAVSLCSSDGVAIDFDERIYASNRHPDFHPDHAIIRLRGYKDSYNWRALGIKLANYFRDTWPGDVREEWSDST